MAELAIRENLDREDLSPIEEATAMKRYMVDFEATTEQVAELWGLKGAASVRTKLRMLSLPTEVKKMVQAGDLPERTARRLIALGRVNPDAAVEVARRTRAEGRDPDDVISILKWKLSEIGRQLTYRHDKGRILDSLWTMRSKMRGSVKVNLADAKNAVAGVLRIDKKEAGKIVKKILPAIEAGEPPPRANVDAIEIIEHLVNPPACGSCSFHAVVDGHDFCLLRACFNGKKRTYVAVELRKAEKALPAVPVYARSDGPALKAGNWNSPIKHSDLIELAKKPHADLRIMPRGSPINTWGFDLSDWPPQSSWVDLVLVGKRAQKANDAKAEDKTGRDQEMDLRQARQRWAETVSALLIDKAGPAFAELWRPLSKHALVLTWEMFRRSNHELYHIDLDPEDAGFEDDAQLLIAQATIDDVIIDSYNATPKEWHGQVKGVATEGGVKLEKGWDAEVLELLEQEPTIENLIESADALATEEE